MISETSLCRDRLKKYCIGTGLDLGFGGDPISLNSITLDLPTPYCIVGTQPQHLRGDARSLYWFKDGVLDYVYSSHLLEDFPASETVPVLREWFRVIRPGGYLVLYCPNQLLYLKDCVKRKSPPNNAHKIINFGLSYLLKIFHDNFEGRFSIMEANEPVEKYSFELVLKKL
ncbi:class I SAM-dependent methyltransferase [Patescibacteria group bacterium]|nr:class I SAM-dependent methyltransferase [Patescibacteria group bacterium]